LQSQGLDGSSPLLRTIEEMAALYVKEIRTLQPHGPYLLGGYCLGGSIAYEAAQQFRAKGEEVALLALLDTMNWLKVPMTIWGKRSRAFEWLIFHMAALLNLDAEGRGKFFKGKIDDLKSRIPVWWGMLLNRFIKQSSTGDVPYSVILGQIWETNHRASCSYVPRPYPGVVTDIRPSKQYRSLEKAELKWDGLAKEGQRIVVTPTYPAAMLLEPYVKDLAVILTKCIDDAVDRSEPIQPHNV
jgi:thioesterase domain-containing protein